MVWTRYLIPKKLECFLEARMLLSFVLYYYTWSRETFFQLGLGVPSIAHITFLRQPGFAFGR